MKRLFVWLRIKYIERGIRLIDQHIAYEERQHAQHAARMRVWREFRAIAVMQIARLRGRSGSVIWSAMSTRRGRS